MTVLITLVVLELLIVVLPDAGLPPAASAGLLALALLAMVALAAVDLNSGFLPRLGFVFGVAWYLGSIGRWVVPMNDVFISAGDAPGMVLAMSLLLVAPLGLLMVSIAGPAAHGWRRWRRGKG